MPFDKEDTLKHATLAALPTLVAEMFVAGTHDVLRPCVRLEQLTVLSQESVAGQSCTEVNQIRHPPENMH